MKKSIAVVLVFVMLMLTGCDATMSMFNDTQYLFGVYTSTGYDSAFLDYTFTAPEGCEMFSLEELATQMGMDVDSFNGDEGALRAEMTEQEYILDMFAYMPTGTNVVAAVTIQTTLGVTMDDMVEAIVKTMPQFNAGATVSGSYETVEFMGRECAKMNASTPMDGMVVTQDVYIFMEPTYIGYVLFTYMEETVEDRDALMNAFSTKQ